MTDLEEMMALLEKQGVTHYVTVTENGYTDILIGADSDDGADRVICLTYEDGHYGFHG